MSVERPANLTELLGRVGPLSVSCRELLDRNRRALAASLGQLLELEAERRSLEQARRLELSRLRRLAARDCTQPDPSALSALATATAGLDKQLDAARERVAQDRQAFLAAQRRREDLVLAIGDIRARLHSFVDRTASEEARARAGRCADIAPTRSAPAIEPAIH